MDIYLIESDYEYSYVIDTAISLIWIDKFDDVSTFELVLDVSDFLRYNIKLGMKLYLPQYSSKHMIIENIDAELDSSDNFTVTIMGRSLESILDRRIIWSPKSFNTNVHNMLDVLLKDNFINGVGGAARKVNNFVIDISETKSYLENFKINETYYGDCVLDLITGLAKDFGFGFELLHTSFSNEYSFRSMLGVDRTDPWATNKNEAFVSFSKQYDNLNESEYTEDGVNVKNCVLVAGEQLENENRKTRILGHSISGLARRETFLDASGITSFDQNGNSIGTATYNQLLDTEGIKILDSLKVSTQFINDVDSDTTFKYGKDYFLGDIVQVVSGLGITTQSRVSEFTIHFNNSEITTYPTLKEYKTPETI